MNLPPKDSAIASYGQYIHFAGSTVSFVAASSMLYLLVSDPNARGQMRPRLLILLAVMDAMGGLTYGLANLPTADNSVDSIKSNPFFVLLLLGNWFTFW